jgi:hypothetical protein
VCSLVHLDQRVREIRLRPHTLRRAKPGRGVKELVAAATATIVSFRCLTPASGRVAVFPCKSRRASLVSDEFTVPLCRTHLRLLHQTGNERWTGSNYDPFYRQRGTISLRLSPCGCNHCLCSYVAHTDTVMRTFIAEPTRRAGTVPA